MNSYRIERQIYSRNAWFVYSQSLQLFKFLFALEELGLKTKRADGEGRWKTKTRRKSEAARAKERDEDEEDKDISKFLPIGLLQVDNIFV